MWKSLGSNDIVGRDPSNAKWGPSFLILLMLNKGVSTIGHLALHLGDLGSISSIPIGSPDHHQE